MTLKGTITAVFLGVLWTPGVSLSQEFPEEALAESTRYTGSEQVGETMWRVLPRNTPYDKWLAENKERIPTFEGLVIQDARTEPLQHWERMGVDGLYIKMADYQITDGWILEVPPKGKTKKQRHMFEAGMYFFGGPGYIEIQQEGKRAQQIDFGYRTLFSIPLNAWHELYNASGEESARLLATTSAPTALNYYASPEFVFNCPMAFLDRFDPDDELYFSGKTTKLEHRFTETNFIPNALAAAMDTWEARGPGTNMMISMANANLVCHMSEFPPMSYKKGHSSRAIRPGRGGNTTAYLMLSGVGYDLQWPNGVKPAPGVPLGERVDYQRHTILTNGAGYHQHFNISEEPIRYLVLRFGNPRFSGGGAGTRNEDAVNSNIEFEDEDPAIRGMFQTELGKRGLESAMTY